MAKKPKLAERWRFDRLTHVGYPLSPANEAVAQLAYYLGAHAALESLSEAHRDKHARALKIEIRNFLLAAGIHS